MSDSAPAAASGADGTAAERVTPARGSRSAGNAGGHGLFDRIGLFLRQIVAELKKVVRPTRSELTTYTSVVVVFVAAVMAFVTVLDYGIGKVTLLVFGG